MQTGPLAIFLRKRGLKTATREILKSFDEITPPGPIFELVGLEFHLLYWKR